MTWNDVIDYINAHRHTSHKTTWSQFNNYMKDCWDYHHEKENLLDLISKEIDSGNLPLDLVKSIIQDLINNPEPTN